MPFVCLMMLSEFMLATVNSVVKLVADWPSQRIMFVRFSIDFCLSTLIVTCRGMTAPCKIDLADLVVRGVACACLCPGSNIGTLSVPFQPLHAYSVPSF